MSANDKPVIALQPFAILANTLLISDILLFFTHLNGQNIFVSETDLQNMRSS